MEDFYVVLPSNSCPLTHPNNNASEFIVSWDSPIQLKNTHDWKVALTEIMFNYAPISVNTKFGIRVKGHVNESVYGYVDLQYKKLMTSPHGTGFVMTLNHLYEESRRHPVKPLWPAIFYGFHHLYPEQLIFHAKEYFEFKFDDIKTANTLGFSSLDVKSVKTAIVRDDETNKFHIAATVKTKLKEDDIADFIKKIHVTMKCNEGWEFTRYLAKGHYWDNVWEMVKFIQDSFSAVFTLTYDDRIKKTQLILKEDVIEVEMLYGLNLVLGFEKNLFKWGREHISKHNPKAKSGMRNMYIYASICSPVQVGDVRVPLLRSIWPTQNNSLEHSLQYGDVQNIIVKNPMYIPVSTSTINNIEINIRSDSGQLIFFPYGSVTSLTLHFKKKL